MYVKLPNNNEWLSAIGNGRRNNLSPPGRYVSCDREGKDPVKGRGNIP